MRITLSLAVFSLTILSFRANCQTESRNVDFNLQKWITIKHSVSPGRTLKYSGQNAKVDFEDIYIKAWFPVVRSDRLKFLLGPHYRAEQVELHSKNESDLVGLTHWNLRSVGMDARMLLAIDDRHRLMVNLNASSSATIQSIPLHKFPPMYMASVAYTTQVSDSRETGFGLMYANNTEGFAFLPFLIWNEKLNDQHAIEINLPRKIAWRYNPSPKNIFHVKAEAVTRSYWVNETVDTRFRRTDLDVGVAYTRLLNQWVGVELFSGYRQNLSIRLPNEFAPKSPPGCVVSFELFVMPAFAKRAK